MVPAGAKEPKPVDPAVALQQAKDELKQKVQAHIAALDVLINENVSGLPQVAKDAVANVLNDVRATKQSLTDGLVSINGAADMPAVQALVGTLDIPVKITSHKTAFADAKKQVAVPDPLASEKAALKIKRDTIAAQLQAVIAAAAPDNTLTKDGNDELQVVVSAATAAKNVVTNVQDSAINVANNLTALAKTINDEDAKIAGWNNAITIAKAKKKPTGGAPQPQPQPAAALKTVLVGTEAEANAAATEFAKVNIDAMVKSDLQELQKKTVEA